MLVLENHQIFSYHCYHNGVQFLLMLTQAISNISFCTRLKENPHFKVFVHRLPFIHRNTISHFVLKT